MKKPIRIYWRENYSDKPATIKRAIKKSIKRVSERLSMYPGNLYEDTVAMIAKKYRVKAAQVILGHGVEGLVHLISQTFLDRGKIGGSFKPCFFVFGTNIDRYTARTFPCHYDKNINFDKYLTYLKKIDLFFLDSPNTETSTYVLSKDQIDKVLKVYKGIFVVDECYYGVGNMTVVDLLKKYSNLIILKSITKTMGLGSLRLGYAFGNKALIKKLNSNFRDVELDPINSFSLMILKEVLTYQKELFKITKDFKRGFITQFRKALPKAKIIRGDTNFFFADMSAYGVDVYKIKNYATEQGFVYSEKPLKDDSHLHFPGFLEVTPPPKQYWNDYLSTIKKAIKKFRNS